MRPVALLAVLAACAVPETQPAQAPPPPLAAWTPPESPPKTYLPEEPRPPRPEYHAVIHELPDLCTDPRIAEVMQACTRHGGDPVPGESYHTRVWYTCPDSAPYALKRFAELEMNVRWFECHLEDSSAAPPERHCKVLQGPVVHRYDGRSYQPQPLEICE